MSERHDDCDPDRDSGRPIRPRVIELDHEPGARRRGDGPRVFATERRGRIVAAQPAARLPARLAPARPKGSRLLKIGMAGLTVFVAGSLALATFDWIASLAVRNPLLAALATLFVACGLCGAALISWHELGSLAKLKTVERIQSRLGAEADPRDARGAVADLVAALPRTRECAAGIEAFQARVQLHHDTAEQVEILKATVMRPLDRRAEAAIRKAAVRAFGITALSPTALTDAVFFLAVSVRMLREIAEVYGLRPTAAAIVHLLRRLVREAGTLGAIDLVTAGLMQHLGAGAAERISSAAGESLYAAQRMARLGIAVMQLVRPLAFAPGELPSLTSLVGGLLTRPSEDRS